MGNVDQRCLFDVWGLHPLHPACPRPVTPRSGRERERERERENQRERERERARARARERYGPFKTLPNHMSVLGPPKELSAKTAKRLLKTTVPNLRELGNTSKGSKFGKEASRQAARRRRHLHKASHAATAGLRNTECTLHRMCFGGNVGNLGVSKFRGTYYGPK